MNLFVFFVHVQQQMAEVVSLVQTLGFDILLIGFLIVLLTLVSRRLWTAELGHCFQAVRLGVEDLERRTRSSTLGELAAMVLLAAAGGVLMNGVADLALDSPMVNAVPHVKLFRTFDALGGDGFRRIVDEYDEEDCLKAKALRDVIEPNEMLRGVFPEFASGQESDDWPCRGEYDDYARAAYQMAIAYIHLHPSSLGASVDGEYLQLRILRALWGSVMLVAVVTALGPGRRALGRLMKHAFSPAADPVSSATRRGWLWAVVLVLGILGTLELWSAQSDRYYKKVFYSYASLVLAGAETPSVSRERAGDVDGQSR